MPNPETHTDDAAGTTEPATDAPTVARTMVRTINDLVPGTLTIHFARRDARFDMLGSDAVRLMAAHRRGRPDDLTDDIDPETSLMLDGWLSIGLHRALAVSWSPGPDAAKFVETQLRERRNKPADVTEAG